ncbi:hypothetical protein I5M27_17520 [Adhaeribacter sp. BT258]|uniref:Uncharacterized protein n=1 Tax=Adhaeribacter terrigena TaxID=2793070 RepID=A0ABS1C890_9BACT|nr:hypothetical protein [Adhaeribacter terrigena]MBK0404795.1 hypothetical protein [Adhaeribacter terrigena]
MATKPARRIALVRARFFLFSSVFQASASEFLSRFPYHSAEFSAGNLTIFNCPDCEEILFSGLYFHAFCVNPWLKLAGKQKTFNQVLLLLGPSAAAYLFFTLNASILELRPNVLV